MHIVFHTPKPYAPSMQSVELFMKLQQCTKSKNYKLISYTVRISCVHKWPFIKMVISAF